MFGAIVVLVAALAVGRGKTKDATIKTLQDDNAALIGRVKTLGGDLEGASKRASDAEKHARQALDDVIHWRAKYDEQERYTAKGALETVGERLASLEATLITAYQGQSDLSLKIMESLVKLDERVSTDARKR